jgi:hypothetical protein
MKNSIFSKFTWILALCAFLFTSSLYVACTKDITPDQTQAVNDPTKAPQVNHELAVKEQVEAIGRMSYSHMKLYFTQKKAEDYVNPAIREEVMAAVSKAKADFKDMTAAETIQKVTDEGKISKLMSQKLTDLLALSETVKYLSTFEKIDQVFKNFETQIYTDKNLTDDEVFYINGMSASIRNSARFTNEMLKGQKIDRNNVTLRDDGCDVIGIKSACLVGALIKIGTAILKADIALWIKGGPTAGQPATSYGNVTKGAFFAGLVDGLIGIFTNNDCKCTTPSSSDGCYHPTLINPFVDINNPCNKNISFIAFGYGTTPSQFIWYAYYTDANGNEVNVPDVQGKITTTPVLKSFPVPDPDAEIRLVVVVPCTSAPGGAYNASFTFKKNELVGNPGEVLVTGPTSVPLNTTGTFYINGSCLANPLNTYRWNNPSAGTVVSGGNTTAANIKFTTRTCYSYNGYTTACFPVYVTGYAISGCLTNGVYRSNGGTSSGVKVP